MFLSFCFLFHFLWSSRESLSKYPRVLDFWQWAWPLVKLYISAQVGAWHSDEEGNGDWEHWVICWGSLVSLLSEALVLMWSLVLQGILAWVAYLFFWLAWFRQVLPTGVVYPWVGVLTAVTCTCSSVWCGMLLDSRIPTELGLEAQAGEESTGQVDREQWIGSFGTESSEWGGSTSRRTDHSPVCLTSVSCTWAVDDHLLNNSNIFYMENTIILYIK